ncbi:MAG: hypothetical protein QOH84_1733 [Kribbellaceae bacterium]|jgi:hypothetical protein|nr:hypothetical protein [Kribbellaceae bacterium]
MMLEATTPPVWLKCWQSSRQAAAMPTALAMQRSVELQVAKLAGVALTIRQLRQAGVYTVTYDEQTDRHLHEVFAPYGITHQPARLPD